METIKDYPDYKITEDGKVFSFKYGNKKQIKTHLTGEGSVIVDLYNGSNEKKSYRMHKLVTEAFIENTQNSKNARHKDGNKQNNNIDNLEWIVRKTPKPKKVKISTHQRTRYCTRCEKRRAVKDHWDHGSAIYCKDCTDPDENKYYSEAPNCNCDNPRVLTVPADSKSFSILLQSHVWCCINCKRVLGKWKFEVTTKMYEDAQERKDDDRFDGLSKPMHGLL